MSSLIHFPTLRTKRLTVQLKELTIGQSISLAGMDFTKGEATTTAFLRMAVQSVTGPQDPLEWTAQERMFVTAHYLSSILDDGPNFSLGEGKYSDYFLGGADNSDIDSVFVGEMEGDKWHLRHLTGLMSESIERLYGLIDNGAENGSLTGRLHWLIGVMAAQMYVEGDSYAPSKDEGQAAVDEWLASRMRILVNFPSSSMQSLLLMYYQGCEELSHLFGLSVDSQGLLALPDRKEGEGKLPPARFPVRSGIEGFVLEMA